MSAATDAIVAQFRALPDEDRFQVVQKIHEIVDPSVEDCDAELKASLDRRWEDIVSGKVKCHDAFAALDEIEARLHERLATAS